jgi:hypothetical protein
MPPEQKDDDGLLFLLLGLAAGAGLLWLWRRRAGGGDDGGPKDRTDALTLVESLRTNGTIDDVTAQAAVDMLSTKGVRPFVVMAWLQERVVPKIPAGYDPFRFQIPGRPSASYDWAWHPPGPPQPPPPPPAPPPAESVQPNPVLPFLDFDPTAPASGGTGPDGGILPGTIVQVDPEGNVFSAGDNAVMHPGSVAAQVGADGALHPFSNAGPDPMEIPGTFVVLYADGSLVSFAPGTPPQYADGAFLFQVGADGQKHPLPWPVVNAGQSFPAGMSANLDDGILRTGPSGEAVPGSFIQITNNGAVYASTPGSTPEKIPYADLFIVKPDYSLEPVAWPTVSGNVLRAGMGTNRDLCCG